jgi:predicted DNA-binding protein (MmcQ/YjbR family)
VRCATVAFLGTRHAEKDVMTWEDLLGYCLAKPGAWQDEPWDGDVVAKVRGKIFAFLGSGTSASIGLKCGANRDTADEWLARYPDDASVMAYIGRSGWNTLRIGGSIPDEEIIEAIDASYAAVVSKLPKKDRPPQTLPHSGRHGNFNLAAWPPYINGVYY